MKLYVLFFGLIIIFTNCVDVSEKNLGGNYKLAISVNYYEGWEVKTIDNIIAIKSKVKEYAFDSTFILINQFPIDSISGIDTMNYYPRRKEAIKKNTFYQYWIIDKSQNNVINLGGRFSNIYGPFKTKEYIQKLKELNVSKKLRLKQDSNMF